ncbi:hypothetical protein YW3DRAFT_05772 [Streptomyces sp. MnatMP-M77]|nr:hypothetical protein [Streptomyces sp. SID8364]SBU96423.1 hypothetical protein YW3DRAFT_05772 [Streptomyces sp. MnatMP-M77]
MTLPDEPNGLLAAHAAASTPTHEQKSAMDLTTPAPPGHQPHDHTLPAPQHAAGPSPAPGSRAVSRPEPVARIQHQANPGIELTARRRETAEHLVAGGMPDRTESTTAVDRTIDQLLASLGVLTVRAACFRLLALGLLPAPAPAASLDLDPVTRTVWEALRWDIHDVDLVPTIAAGLSTHDGPLRTAGEVNNILDRLAQRYATSRLGLIRAGFAHGVLSADQGVAPPVHGFAAATRPGAGAWDASPAHRRVLALRASGRDVAACARADGTTVDAVTGRLSAAKRMAGGVRTHRALIHRALCDGVLQSPAVQQDTDSPQQKLAVWRHFALDVPDNALIARIATHTGLGMSVVERFVRDLRIRYRDDCAVIHEGWRYGVLDAGTPTGLACCTAPDRSTAVSGGAW